MILLEDIILEGDIHEILPAGSIIEAVIDLDAEEDTEAVAQDEMINIIQNWIDNNKPRFTQEGWSKIVDILQPAIDAIYNKNAAKLKRHAIALADKAEELKENPRAKLALEKIHDLFVKLLGMARGHFSESIDDIINILS